MHRLSLQCVYEYEWCHTVTLGRAPTSPPKVALWGLLLPVLWGLRLPVLRGLLFPVLWGLLFPVLWPRIQEQNMG